MFFITDDVLENLICDGCKNYLSVSPVKVYPNKQILCGRCSKHYDGGVISVYNNVVKRGLFKCINRYEGCNEVLIYSEVENHEVNCKSKFYDCPNCLLIPKMSSQLLIHHFREWHKTEVLKKSSFSINMDLFNADDGMFLYMKDNCLFIIRLQLNNSRLLLNTFHIGNESFSREIQQSFMLSSSDGTLRYHTGKRPCSIYNKSDFNEGFVIDVKLKETNLNVDFDLDTRRVQKLLLIRTVCDANNTVELDDQNQNQNILISGEHEIYLSEIFKSKWFPRYSLHSSGRSVVNVNNKILNQCLLCYNKFHYFSSNQSIYKCTECNLNCGTFICSRCYFFGIKKCGEMNYEFAPEETTVAKDIQYFCRWKCKGKYFSWYLKDHEYNCDYQMPQICPIENCKWKGKIFTLRDHINNHHANVIFVENHSIPLRLLKTTNFIFKNELVFHVSNYFVCVKWKKMINHYLFSLNIKNSNDKIPIAIISNNGKIDIFDKSFVIDNVEGAPLLLITLK